MTILSAYLDDSQHDGIFVVAGYIGHLSMWEEEFTPAWNAVLANAPHPLTEFKASDCRQMAGEFSEAHGWTRAECNKITSDLVGVIADCSHEKIVGVGAAVLLRDVEKHIRDTDRVFGFSYQLCLTALFHDLVGISSQFLTEGGAIQIVLDQQEGHTLQMQERFASAVEALGSSAQCQFPTPRFEESHLVASLQAADLLAYETGKEMANRLEVPERTPSRALRRLIYSRFHRAYYMDIPWLQVAWPQSPHAVPTTDIPPMHVLYDSREPLRGYDSWEG